MKQFESTAQINFSQRSVHFQRLDKLHKTIIRRTTVYKPTSDQSSARTKHNFIPCTDNIP